MSSSQAEHSPTHPAKRRKSTHNSETIKSLLMDFKPSQLRQVIEIALSNGNLTKSIRHIHAQLPGKSSPENHSEPSTMNSAPVTDEIIESIEKSPLPRRHLNLVPETKETRQPPSQSLSAKVKEGLSDSATQSFVHIPKNVSGGNLPTPRNFQEPKEIPMTPEPWMTPEPEIDAHSLLPEPELYVCPPPVIATCNCRSGCSSTRCKCFKSGHGCSPSPSSGCKCESCVNMLNDLSSFFGSPKSSYFKIAASPDFLKWIRKESRNGRFDLIYPDTIEELRSMLMGVKFGDTSSPPNFPVFSGKLRGIRRAWMKANITDDEREDVKKELFKEAFGVMAEPKNDYWCFCKNEWRQTILWAFCAKCDECRDTREWHCEKCGHRNIGENCECKRAIKRKKGDRGQ
ncbi:hypothetical protein sscle_06g052340 [Sclerotinia sclerotiorum 1980 UF-70]|uniref:Tesmin/TSO1-like CXC domain-containing protein n=2 Tax=Sclerotinia sclerotiorum (strain ATCC 18683 / 1980 / Ss-1) TaxID=665079 RepID=A0A1D9Q684_SCLS1|nr:hypothetical protein sscle_06g052340 [Sclerotinia sclerotiorum 1980 UF-70]